ncbi:BTAD domain-containing putative transcriptional regulator [Pseudonocardia humida]|uniref:FHA domain-containing protein n=1 Tax=Pseudonocardia humida TaxID=2800819 RepID=A0ABT1A6P1_9PSEU|nr:BTAD domain-containing putative transcriptional regulator [Pseudonocardia humida]MCO1658674.1 FHA domain-containing protein [Pseudonocardia humida]
MSVAVGLLGEVTLTVDGERRAVAGVRRRAVLAVLAASAGSPVAVDRLHDAVWSDTGSPASRGTLQVHVHGLRQELAPHAGVLTHTSAGYRLDDVEVDVRQAEDALRRARAADRAGDAAGAEAAYRAGLALWRGEFCADLRDFAYLRAARSLYETVRLDATEAMIGAALRTGAPGLVAELEDLVAEHPLRERLWGQLMVALHRDGRQADALGAYHRARKVLVDEVGLDPGSALRNLEAAILGRADTAELLRFGEPGTAGPVRPALTWVDGSGLPRRRDLPADGELVIGRSDAADIALTWDAAVSRRHAALVVRDGAVLLRDLGSRNGTFHNGDRLDPAGPDDRLRVGDLVRCGDTVLAVTGPTARQAGPTDPTRDDAR